jgi:hypothetical protein
VIDWLLVKGKFIENPPHISKKIKNYNFVNSSAGIKGKVPLACSDSKLILKLSNLFDIWQEFLDRPLATKGTIRKNTKI